MNLPITGGLDMSILKYTAKYFLISALGALVLLGISLLWIRRGSSIPVKAVKENAVSLPESAGQSPAANNPRAAQLSPGVHRHNDGTLHAEPHSPAIRPKTGSRSRGVKAANRSSLGWISWKHGKASGAQSDPYRYDFIDMEAEITDALLLLQRERKSRESLHRRIADAERYDIAIDLDDTVDFIGRMRNLPDARALLLDKKGRPLPLITDEVFKAREWHILVGDRNLEEATQFLEARGYYSETLLEQLDGRRAFEYMFNIETLNTRGDTRPYAERVLALDPDNLKARLYLADTSSRAAGDLESTLAQYEAILTDHPDSPHALIQAGILHSSLDAPFKAISYFKKGHQLGAARGFFETAIAHQKLGDYKTAWVYLNKAIQLPVGHYISGHGPRGHLRAIEAGNPRIIPLPLEKLDFPETGLLPTDPAPISEFAINTDVGVPVDIGLEEPFDPAILDDTASQRAEAAAEAAAKARAAAAAAAREEIRMIQQMSQQEIDDFIQWAKALMRAETATNPNDFLMREMSAHLTGGQAQFDPQRIVRAVEIMDRYGPTAGLERLKKSDPEVVIQIQFLLNQEPIPEIKK